jgi:hypothetical protein
MWSSRRIVRSALLVIAVSALPLAAEAQEAAPPIKEREVTQLVEIEHGFYFRGSGGAFFLNSLPATQGPRPFSTGQMAQIELGFDLGERFSIGVFVMGTANRAGSDYIGNSGGSASGDVSGIIPGAAARFSLIGFSDSNDVKRTWLYVRGGIGYARFYPSALMPPDAWVFAGPGIEYFTRIRHFSIGFEVNASYLLKSKTFGFALAPNLRYAF